MIKKLFAGLMVAAVLPAQMALGDGCARDKFEGNSYVVCQFDISRQFLGLYLYDDTGRVIGDFNSLAKYLKTRNRKLVFAINAGMYQVSRLPVGLFVTEYKQIKRLNQAKASGNFYLKPNGVFHISGGRAFVEETSVYKARKRVARIATQSGPMLVIRGKYHPKFLPDSDSVKIRNGVGVVKGGKIVKFAISATPVNFYQFARLFKLHLNTPNALFLDGSISKIYAPDVARHDFGRQMGPILAISR